jgi:predicted transcriptional regulator
MSEETNLDAVELATELTIAWLGNQNNRIAADEVPTFLKTMHATVTELATGVAASTASGEDASAQREYTPAVTVRKSLASREHILSLIDGKPYKALRRHLATNGLTPEEYRARYNLKPDYPMVAPAYAETRRELAKKIGLGSKGRKARTTTTGAAEKSGGTAATAARKPGRPRKPAA